MVELALMRSIFMLCTLGLAVLQAALSARSICRYRSKLWCAWRRLVWALSNGISEQSEEKTLLDAYILKGMNRRWVSRSRSLASGSAKALSFLGVPSVVNHFTGQPRWMSVMSDLSYLASLVLATVGDVFPSVICPDTLVQCYSLGMALLILSNIVVQDRVIFVTLAGSCFFGRILLLWAYTNVRLAVFWNMVHSSAVIFVYCEMLEPASGRSMPLGAFAGIELGMCTALIFVAVGWNDSLRTELSREIQAKLIKSESSALTSLLNMVCDVVIELDEDLRITEHASRLAALLMLGSDQSSRGIELTNYFAHDSDKEAFQTTMRSFSFLDDPVVGTMNVKMRDALGSLFEVELFFATFEGMDGKMLNVLGMREFTDFPLAPLRSDKQGEERNDGASDGSSATSSVAAESSTITPSADVTISAATDDPYIDVLAERARQRATQGLVDPTRAQQVPQIVGTRLGSSRLLLPNLQETNTRAMALSLVNAMLRWNVVVPVGSCCRFHAVVRQGHTAFKRLWRGRCKHDYKPAEEDQCQQCGLLGGEDEISHGRCVTCNLPRPVASDAPHAMSL